MLGFRVESFWVVATGDAPRWVADLGYSDFADAWSDRQGRVMRQTPDRITFEHRLDDGRVVFRKLRLGRPGDATNEWRRMHQLDGLGLSVPQPLFFARDGRRTAIAFSSVAGSDLRQMLIERGRPPEFEVFFERRVAPAIRRLHEAGMVHRDLYWNHLFAADLDPSGPPVSLIDLERVRDLRGLRRRWIVKDLASLCSSWPLEDDALLLGRCLRTVVPEASVRCRIWRPILQKAARIRAHVPKWSGVPEGDPESWPDRG